MYVGVPPLNGVVMDNVVEFVESNGLLLIDGLVSIGLTVTDADAGEEVPPFESVTVTLKVYGLPELLVEVTVQVLLEEVHAPEDSVSPDGTVQSYET